MFAYTTLSTSTLRILTLSITTLNKTSLNIMAFARPTLYITTHVIMTLDSKNQHNDI
jgi:hypothetical protein